MLLMSMLYKSDWNKFIMLVYLWFWHLILQVLQILVSNSPGVCYIGFALSTIQMHKSNETLTITLLTSCCCPPGRAICDPHVFFLLSTRFHGWRDFFCYAKWSSVISREVFSEVIFVCVCVWGLSAGCSHSKCLRKRPPCYILLTFQTSHHTSCMVNWLLKKHRGEAAWKRKKEKWLFDNLSIFLD